MCLFLIAFCLWMMELLSWSFHQKYALTGGHLPYSCLMQCCYGQCLWLIKLRGKFSLSQPLYALPLLELRHICTQHTKTISCNPCYPFCSGHCAKISLFLSTASIVLVTLHRENSQLLGKKKQGRSLLSPTTSSVRLSTATGQYSHIIAIHVGVPQRHNTMKLVFHMTLPPHSPILWV